MVYGLYIRTCGGRLFRLANPGTKFAVLNVLVKKFCGRVTPVVLPEAGPYPE